MMAVPVCTIQLYTLGTLTRDRGEGVGACYHNAGISAILSQQIKRTVEITAITIGGDGVGVGLGDGVGACHHNVGIFSHFRHIFSHFRHFLSLLPQ